jgi:hypothetical protein
MDIMGALTVVKQTIDITKDLRNIDEKIDAATWKLRLSDLIDKLIDTKDALIEARDRESQLIAKVKELEAKLEDHGKYLDEDGLLFELNDQGVKTGEPFCNQCFVKEGLLFRLLLGPYMPGAYKCSNCEGFYGNSPKFDAY